VHELLASAYAQLGHIGDARRELAAYTAMEPWVTLRWLRHLHLPSDAAVAERAREIDGLAKAGLRDHAEEEADTGIDAQISLRPHDYMSPTPRGAPGVTTITTVALSAMLAREDGAGRPVILGTTLPIPDFRLPKLHELPGVFAGDSFDADAQHAFVRKIDQLTGGDKTRPVVTAGWNSERWSARNLALQLVALGYQNVYLYRGGLEAWDLAGLPEESHTRYPVDEASADESVESRR
jgi:rhodanese-related sulfurtransferase